MIALAFVGERICSRTDFQGRSSRTNVGIKNLALSIVQNNPRASSRQVAREARRKFLSITQNS